MIDSKFDVEMCLVEAEVVYVMGFIPLLIEKGCPFGIRIRQLNIDTS